MLTVVSEVEATFWLDESECIEAYHLSGFFFKSGSSDNNETVIKSMLPYLHFKELEARSK